MENNYELWFYGKKTMVLWKKNYGTMKKTIVLWEKRYYGKLYLTTVIYN